MKNGEKEFKEIMCKVQMCRTRKCRTCVLNHGLEWYRQPIYKMLSFGHASGVQDHGGRRFLI